MSTVSAHLASPAAATRADAFPTLAVAEIRRYLRHPLYWVGSALLLAAALSPPDPVTSTVLHYLASGAGLGLVGMVVMISLTRRAERTAAVAGVVTVPERVRTLALASAAAVPLVTALAWYAWDLSRLQGHTPRPNGILFGPADKGWAAWVMLDMGVLAALGGPLFGLLLARWVRIRGLAPVAVVATVIATILMQGLFEPLRRIRLVMPWTHFAGQFGVPDDPNRMLLLTGSPRWYAGYLVCLCCLAVLLALLADREGPRRRLWVAVAGVGLVAIVLCVLAINGGVQDVIVNPHPSTD